MNAYGLTHVQDEGLMLLVNHTLVEVLDDLVAMLPDRYQYYETEAASEWLPLVRQQLQVYMWLEGLINDLPYWMRELWEQDNAYWKPLHGYVQDYNGQWVKPEDSICGDGDDVWRIIVIGGSPEEQAKVDAHQAAFNAATPEQQQHWAD